MIRVGFIVNDSNDGWLGGLNYFRNLISSVSSRSERRIEPVILTGQKINLDLLKGFSGVEIIQTSLLEKNSHLWILRRMCKRLLKKDFILECILKKNGISLLSHSGHLGRKASFPTIGWIPDFQHRHLPMLFSNEELDNRDREFMNLLKYCSSVFLSSYDAQKDLKEFAPELVSKSRILHFSVEPTLSVNGPDRAILEETYGFSGEFFFVPNQFWIHKNHRVIVEALRILKESDRNVVVLATGNTKDYRQPNYFTELMNLVEKCEVKDFFRVLGVIPYSDLLALMKYSKAIINPSLFEGWSTTVEEAKSLGKRIILSDIAVHREQDPPGGAFFLSSNPNSLADVMWNIWNLTDEEEDQKLIYQARESLEERKNNFARVFENTVLEALEGFVPTRK